MSEHAALFRQCLIDLDVRMMRQLWWHVARHLPQPRNDDECLETMHTARVAMTTLPEDLRAYSEQWLAERRTTTDAWTTGVMVRDAALGKPRGLGVEDAMVDALERALDAGLSARDDAPEIRRRMLAARQREHTAPFVVRR